MEDKNLDGKDPITKGRGLWGMWKKNQVTCSYFRGRKTDCGRIKNGNQGRILTFTTYTGL